MARRLSAGSKPLSSIGLTDQEICPTKPESYAFAVRFLVVRLRGRQRKPAGQWFGDAVKVRDGTTTKCAPKGAAATDHSGAMFPLGQGWFVTLNA
jgi:hypothetical protein